MSETHFLTYATLPFATQRNRLAASARAAGFDHATALAPEHLAHTDFWRHHRAILTQPRGAGFWLWKPYIIATHLADLPPGDVLLYCDAGRDGFYRFTRRPDALIAHARARGFITGITTPQHGPLAHWTKRDCLLLMNADHPEITTRPMIQATWSLWTNTSAARDFLAQWLAFATDPRCLTDQPNTLGQPNHPGFRDHRHDQAIATLLAYKHDAPHLDITGTQIERLLALRPQSSLAHRFLKRPQHADMVLSRQPLLPALIGAQAQLWSTAR